MCRQVTCPNCGRPTWAGCGLHIEQALADVPKDERCHCREAGSQGARQSTVPGSRSWLKRLLGG